METVARRHARLPDGRPHKMLQYINEFRMLYANEKVHTLEGGVIRRKRRRSRRPTLPRESVLAFYPKFAAESARKLFNYWWGFRQQKAVLKRVLSDPARYRYEDQATRPLSRDELDALDLIHGTRGGVAAVEKQHKQEAIFEAVRTAREAAA